LQKRNRQKEPFSTVSGEICNFEKAKITNIIFSPDLIVYQPSMMKKLEC
jgi:hypothetical protein